MKHENKDQKHETGNNFELKVKHETCNFGSLVMKEETRNMKHTLYRTLEKQCWTASTDGVVVRDETCGAGIWGSILPTASVFFSFGA